MSPQVFKLGWMNTYLAGYLAAVFVIVALDMLWLGLIANAVLTGALFGFFAYATYDLSNLAALRNWPVGVTRVDVAWGTLLGAAAAAADKAALSWAAKA